MGDNYRDLQKSAKSTRNVFINTVTKVEKGHNSNKIQPMFYRSLSDDLLHSPNKLIRFQGPISNSYGDSLLTRKGVTKTDERSKSNMSVQFLRSLGLVWFLLIIDVLHVVNHWRLLVKKFGVNFTLVNPFMSSVS